MTYVSPTALKWRAKIEAANAAKLSLSQKSRRPDQRRARLIADGRKALALRKQGMRPMDVLMVIGGSRPRMYKAMDAAEAKDPLLL
jgi:hypothetical protein